MSQTPFCLESRTKCLAKQLGMRAKTDKINLVGIGVKPYKQKVPFNMALHMTGIVTHQ